MIINTRRVAAAMLSLAVSASLLLGVTAPASATAAVSLDPDQVHAGYYSEVFWLGDELDAMAAASGGHRVSMSGIFMDTYFPAGVEAHIPGKWNNVIELLNQAWKGESTPVVNAIVGAAHTADIAAGTHDANIRQWGGYLKRWLSGEVITGDADPAPTADRSLVIAPMQEMNWVGGDYQCQPATFEDAYRRFVDLVEDELGAYKDQVRWMFAPNGATADGCGTIADYYPGDAYADFGGVSAYNWNGITGPNQPVSEVIGWALDDLRPVMPHKPMIVAQTAACTVNPGRDVWVDDVFDFVEADPNAIGFIYFNHDKECDWRIFDGVSAAPGWVSGMAGSDHEWPLSDWFVPGTKLVIAGTPDPCGTDCDVVSFIDVGAQFHRLDELTNAYYADEFYFGNPGDYPLTGDWNCDGKETPGQYRQSDGFVYLRDSNTSGIADRQFYLGDPGDIPLVGDFDNNGCDTVSIYRPSEAKFYIANSLAADFAGIVADYSFYFGDPGDKPFTGDFNGNGVDTVGLHRESTGRVYFRNTNDTGIADADFIFGDPGDKLLSGDWDGDGDDTVAVYRASNGFFYAKLNNTPGFAEVAFYVGSGFVGIGVAPM